MYKNSNSIIFEDDMMSEYTSKQLEAVLQFKKCKNYYEMLGISINATPENIQKAFRKKALLFHPDKNKAPGSVEAFNGISKAYTTLFDSSKRSTYDMVEIRGCPIYSYSSRPYHRSATSRRFARPKMRYANKQQHSPGIVKPRQSYYYMHGNIFPGPYAAEPDVPDSFLHHIYNQMRFDSQYISQRTPPVYLGMFMVLLIRLCSHFCS